MALKITKEIANANLITHSSTFHPDDVFSTVLLSKIIDNPTVCRTVDVKGAKEEAIIYDVGFGKFDHHGPNPIKRTNPDIPYCSFGLLWKEYGKEYLKTLNPVDVDKLWEVIDTKLVMQIDAIDNGIFPNIEADFHLSDLDKIIDLFNEAWNEEVDNDDQFIKAVNFAEIIFDRFIFKENARLAANIRVEEAIEKVKDNILFLDEHMPYEEALWHSTNPKANEVKVIIFPSKRGGYSIKPRTVSETSKDLAYVFSKEYLGLHDEELAKVSNIPSARFVHSSGFLACSGTLEDAYLLAKNAIENKE